MDRTCWTSSFWKEREVIRKPFKELNKNILCNNLYGTLFNDFISKFYELPNYAIKRTN